MNAHYRLDNQTGTLKDSIASTPIPVPTGHEYSNRRGKVKNTGGRLVRPNVHSFISMFIKSQRTFFAEDAEIEWAEFCTKT